MGGGGGGIGVVDQSLSNKASWYLSKVILPAIILSDIQSLHKQTSDDPHMHVLASTPRLESMLPLSHFTIGSLKEAIIASSNIL